MNKAIIVAILLTYSLAAFSQNFDDGGAGMFGVEGGAGKATIIKSYLMPAAQAYCYKKFSRTFYFGGIISYQRYSFLDNLGLPVSGLVNQSVLSIRQQSGYIFFCPSADAGIGYRKYIHIRASFGAGLLADGIQAGSKYQQYQTLPPQKTAYDTAAYSSSGNIPTLVSRLALGVTERIPTSGYWNIVLSQEFSYIPTNLTDNGLPLKTNYFAFTIGVMHKYPMVLVEY